MNKKMLIILGIILIILVVVIGYKLMSKSPKDKPNPTPNPNIDINISDIDINFLKLENKKENIIYSPLSIKYALSMLKEGADGNTLKEIEDVLGNQDLPTYKNIDKVLSLTNGLFIRDTFKNKIKSEYVNTLKNNYQAEVKYDKFKNANNVNNWIEDKTFKIIKDVITDKMVKNEDLKLLLINALAIDMKWQEEFDESNTRPDSFTTEDNNNLEVTMMHLTTESENIKYYQNNEITSVSLPLRKYENTNLEFIAIMPNTKLSDYISNLTTDKINENLSNLQALNDNQKLNLNIPKFAYNYSLDFMNDLNSLGIKEVFTTNASLDKIATEKLYVSDAIHKADIKFSEEGIKAAAVTVFGITTSGMIQEEKEIINIKYDKPFIYLIKDSDNDTIWFVGSVYKPNLWENDKQEYTPDYGY